MSSFVSRQLGCVVRSFRSIWRWTIIHLAILVAQIERRRPTMLSDTEGALPLGPRIALFCHWDGRGRIHEHVRRYVDALRAQGLSVVFVSNAEWLMEKDAAWAASACSRVILRRNVGYDFGCWKEAMQVLGLPRADTQQIILVNDSVYGPFFPLDDVMRRIAECTAPVCGLTDSWQRRYHLQSYFVALTPEAFRSATWATFWQNVLPSRSKLHVVEAYEIGFSRAMLHGGLHCAVLWPYEALIDMAVAEAKAAELRRAEAAASPDSVVQLGDPLREDAMRHLSGYAAIRVALNPTADFWSILLDLGFPFLKRELLRSNPSSVMDVSRWRAQVRAIAPEEAEVIRRDLMLALRQSAP